MRVRTFAAALAIGMLGSASAAAQDDDKPPNSDDEVFDNTTLGEKRRQQSAKERREKYGGDSPFAGDEAPVATEKREERFSPGVQGGYRAGWGIPTGHLHAEERFTDVLTGMLFLWGDGGYRFIPQLTLGFYLSAGYVFPDCAQDVSCTIFDFRGGLQAQWRFLPFADFTPWVGIGAGWELFLISGSTPLRDVSYTYHGPELLLLQGGVDVWAPTARGHAGIFVAYSMGRFISKSVSLDPEPDPPPDFDPETDTHNWIFIGGRGTF
jgi:hypothetical protein